MKTHIKLSRHRTWSFVLLSLFASVQMSAQDPVKIPVVGPNSANPAEPSKSSKPAADDADQTTNMNPFVVSSDSIKGYVASDTLSGGKVAMKIIDVPQTINVITREAIDDSGLTDPNQIFEKFAAGVSNLTGPGIEGTNAIIRGFRAQNWSVNGATTHYLSELNSDNFENIEVIKGPAVMMFGHTAGYGGYINIDMKTPSRTPIDTVLFGAGTAGLTHEMIDYGQALGENKDFQYRVVLSHQDFDYPSRNYDYNKVWMIAPSLAYDINKNTRLVTRYEFIKSDQSWTPSQLDVNGNLIRAFSANEAESDMGDFDTDRVAQAILTTQFNDEWSLRLNTLLQQMSNNWKYSYGMTDPTPGLPAQYYVFLPNQRVYTQKSWFTDAALAWNKDDLGHGMSNQAYFDLGSDNFTENIIFLANNFLSSTTPGPNPLIDPSNPNLSAMMFQFNYPTETVPYVTSISSSGSLGDTFGLFDKKLLLTYRIKYNYDQSGSLVRLDSPANTPPPVGVLTGTPAAQVITEKTTMDYGIVYKPTPNWSIYFGHTEAYNPVSTGFTVSGQALSPESGKDDEIGTKVDMPLFGGYVTGSLAYFSMSVSNKWRPDPFNPGYFVQDGEQVNKGIEGQLGYNSKWFAFTGGFYTADGPYQKNQPATGIFPAGNLRAVYAPKITYQATLKVNLTPSLAVGGGYRYQGDQVASTRLLISPGFGTTDLFAQYTMKLTKGQLKFNLTCTNVADGTGFMREDTPASVYVQEGRRTTLTATYSW